MLSKFQFTYHYAESGGAALTRLNLESTQYSMHFFFLVLENHHHHSATAQKEILTCAIYESAPDHRLFILFGSLGIGKMVFFFFFFCSTHPLIRYVSNNAIMSRDLTNLRMRMLNQNNLEESKRYFCLSFLKYKIWFQKNELGFYSFHTIHIQKEILFFFLV